jgi:hypothetical protein
MTSSLYFFMGVRCRGVAKYDRSVPPRKHLLPLLFALPLLALDAGGAQAPRRCDLKQATDGEYTAQAGQSARLAEISRTTLGRFDALMKSREWNQDAPVREQLSLDERATLAGIQAQMQANLVALLFESRRERDIRIISRMAGIADARAHASPALPADEASDDYFLLTLLSRMDTVARPSIEDGTTADATACNLEHALWDAAVKVANEGAAMPELKHMASTTSMLAQKYGNPIPPPEELEPADRELFNSLVPALQHMRATRMHAESLMKLALLESTSKAMLRAWHQDQSEMPGDISHTGTTWQRWAQQGVVTPSQHQMVTLLNAINQRIPADAPASAARRVD